MPPLPPASRHGTALIVTLCIVSLVSILVTGFLTSMRLEVSTSSSHYDRVRAGLYAQMGGDAAASRIRAAISDTNLFWVTFPGRCYVSSPGTNLWVTNAVDLSSGGMANAGRPTADQAVNLNAPTLADPSMGLLRLPSSSTLYVSWVYQRSDGTLDTNAPPAYVAANPVVGRYAFWVDDESARLDMNTAGSRSGSTRPLSDPSRVNLEAVSSADAAAVAAYAATNRFHSLAEVGRANLSASARQQFFAFTWYNHAPDLDMFGEPRLILTTQQSVAMAMGSTNFLDILASPNTDPGTLAALNGAKVSAAVSGIIARLNRPNWPILPGATFAAKYPANPDVAQIALNIVDYVRSAESTNACVEPLRGSVSGTGANEAFSFSAGSGSRVGNARRPVIVEFGVWINPVISPTVPATTPATYTVTGEAKERIALPADYGLASLDVTTINLHGSLYLVDPAGNSVGVSPAFGDGPITAAEAGGRTILTAGHSLTVTRAFTVKNYTSSSRPVKVKFGPGLATGSGNTHLLILGDIRSAITIPIDAAGVTDAAIRSYSPDDPLVIAQNDDWKTNAANMFGSTNTAYSPVCTVGQAAGSGYAPPQDTDAGTITDVSAGHFPAPKGAAANPSGLVQSVGELGFVHAGMGDTASGVPWRTLRLQPEGAASATLPDWAILDLFSAPVVPTAGNQPFVAPFAAATNDPTLGGRVNLNAAIWPWNGAAGGPGRMLPLQALVLGAAATAKAGATNTVSASGSPSMTALATNLAGRVLAAGGRTWGGNADALFSPAQVSELAGVGDAGEPGEALVREIVSLATVRGGVFSIYSVGQALKQDPSGTITVLAEERDQRVIERVVTNGVVDFLPVFSRILHP